MLKELRLGCGDDGTFDVLLASNMISVGIDIPRLGLMMMVGQPKTISEYIQATSRVGRGSVPGLVVSLYNAGRARDRAHFETFGSWHSSLYREVEATSVTPFAPRAQDKALHAVMVTLARHLIGALRSKPTLEPALRPQLDDIAAKIVARAEYVDAAEASSVSAQLRLLLDEWEHAAGLESYWDDYGKKRSLLISAEQAAAGGSPEDDDVDKPWLWPTPNSMREVEPSTNYVLVGGLKAEEGSDGA
jgi:superfamily II DNA/RNA helicase